jgi:hypothetical protein
MKTLILTSTAVAFAITPGAAAQAGVAADSVYAIEQASDSTIDKRRKPRIKGGSGCDDAHDIIEHPECR